MTIMISKQKKCLRLIQTFPYINFKPKNNLQVIGNIVIRNPKVLHLACLHNNTKLIELTLTYCRNSNLINQTQMIEFINLQNKDGFTPLLMASFKGNIEIIKLLLQIGANSNIKNTAGLSVLHMSVQGDHVKASVLSLNIQLFWINQNIPIDILDYNHQTPLICASFLGSQQMVNFLIPWGAKLNAQTKDKGHTALHVATQQGHSRIVRKLLIKGIDRKIKDKNGKTALDLAIDSKFKSIQTMIENKMGLAERCGLRQPDSKVEKNYISMTIYLSLYCSSFLLTISFTLPCNIYLMTKSRFRILLGLVHHSMQSNSPFDLGSRQKKSRLCATLKQNLNGRDLLDAYSVDQICPDCSDVKPPRSRHCEICLKCVYKYDHHCPWLSNCIGEKNQYIFLAFLFTLIASMVLQIVVQCQILNLQQEEEEVELGYVIQQITFYYTMIVGCLFILPVMLLFTVQIYNLIKGQTTYERYIERQGINRMQSRKASAEQQLKLIKSAASTDTSESEFKFTIKSQKKPLLKETELIV
ncbi:unnamed protein product (macronuclear) [Paramecium tetraurelia]|uniref:Palmitoyltransferase n=1 Tax=Paramecium tetraurelia TaxID=5888 RepID=A0BG14_PARTE|nr:uncharacterized protein GSPATT00028516001 [Paramecium tetraurelia]CAK57481.1 unnamed protein product [Paramecium tetraurelia]|eukprot:XP_001424879.1 hypothetical protein (macronuclear) [Paramecium tetraurelia strain d4-2]